MNDQYALSKAILALRAQARTYWGDNLIGHYGADCEEAARQLFDLQGRLSQERQEAGKGMSERPDIEYLRRWRQGVAGASEVLQLCDYALALETQLAETHRQLDNVTVERDEARKYAFVAEDVQSPLSHEYIRIEDYARLHDQVVQGQRERDRLRQALQPFADRYNFMCPTMPTVAEFRAAGEAFGGYEASPPASVAATTENKEQTE